MNKALHFASVILLFMLISCNGSSNDESADKDTLLAPPPVIEYGFNLDSFQVIRDTVQNGWKFSKVLYRYGV